MKKIVLIWATTVIASASAQPIDGVPTIFLEAPDPEWGAPMAVAYHPDFDQYYTGGGGLESNSAYVYDSAGNLLQHGAIDLDVRALYYNRNTHNLEAVTFVAQSGGKNAGLYSIGLDGDGRYDGKDNRELATLPGLFNWQTVPGYDPANDVFYSSTERESIVHVVDRADGELNSSFVLALNDDRINSTEAIGYDPNEQWIMVGDAIHDQVHVFDTSGSFIGTSNIPGEMPTTWGFAYANAQVFAYDHVRGGWQGYDIGAVPAPASLALLGLAGLVATRRRR